MANLLIEPQVHIRVAPICSMVLVIEFRLAATKLGTDTNSPYIDGRPLATPGVAEMREYMARGMMGDEEVGLESLIVSLNYAG